MACQVTESFANRACLARWEDNCSRPIPRIQESAARMQRDYGRIFHRGHKEIDLIESMPRRISACIAARGGFTTDF
ncbi:hypothetical protein TNCV_4949671 [Trichonephila clavipes]|nr:hypothetical protein TNCV_4949671 [Trichonephila clavipes]